MNTSDNPAEEEFDNQQRNNHLHKASLKVITSFIDNAIRQNLTETEFVKGIIAIHDTLKQDTIK